jgi:hypothetical protein
METLPPLVLEDFQYVPKGKPVLLLLPSGDVIEFSTVQSASDYLESARRMSAAGAQDAALFSFQNGAWVRLS